MFSRTVTVICLASFSLLAADKYDGPLPPKPDIPYLLHASNLIETEVGQARQDKSSAVIAGASSPARTPLAEPIFIINAQSFSPDRLELARLEVKGGNREVSLGSGKRRGARFLHLAVTPLGNRLFKVEVDEPLENGEYALSPSGDNRVFCFEVY